MNCVWSENSLKKLTKSVDFELEVTDFNRFLIGFDSYENKYSIKKEYRKLLSTFLSKESENFEQIVNESINRVRMVPNSFSPAEKDAQEKLQEYTNTLDTIHYLSYNLLLNYSDIFAKKLRYIGPFRDIPQRTYRSSEAIYNYVGKSGEYTSNLLKQAQQNQRPLFDKISDWFTQTMGYSIGVEKINGANLFKIKVYSEKDKRGKDLIDVGFGISQILPIITQLYYDRSKDDYTQHNNDFEFFVIEQPEIHLHPNAQAELANLFVDKVQSTKEKDVTLLIETHSEHLVRRLQSLVADPDNDFNREDVAVYYVDMDAEGVSTVKKMEMQENGQFEERWPSGFFDKAYQLSKELMRNANKRATK